MDKQLKVINSNVFDTRGLQRGRHIFNALKSKFARARKEVVAHYRTTGYT